MYAKDGAILTTPLLQIFFTAKINAHLGLRVRVNVRVRVRVRVGRRAHEEQVQQLARECCWQGPGSQGKSSCIESIKSSSKRVFLLGRENKKRQ